ncbi:hypothetical protein HN415_01135 [Candidatus Woesearchaeota archaeon]|jgi:hypothetical protein|nr:hypothetical protein [Candidatus Woesearchaeota archaeon]
MGIKIKKNEVHVSLNHEIYSSDAINLAIKDYKDVCDVIKKEDYLVLTPKEEIELDQLGYEFSNYVLGLMKNY